MRVGGVGGCVAGRVGGRVDGAIAVRVIVAVGQKLGPVHRWRHLRVVRRRPRSLKCIRYCLTLNWSWLEFDWTAV